jgi:deferrochelatase/peroxidase EfeB
VTIYRSARLTLLLSFGFKDGISQPIIEGWDEKQPQGKEPKAAKPGLE